ncbi:response regulator transcription factor [Paenibacillus cremeus]|uniref:Response regulator n=1 Tax=Paenibacillus cremeus TaxID=2163881 RepID=A0A559K7U3_9BACL|nr:response regulator [Paenibacillus cremeus]TVY08188.1 response regulator [Paenibacillus cremeus]
MPMNIVIVEDEHWALAELAEVMKVYEPEHRVFAFDNGEDVLQALDSVVPQLVLTDINMPGIDGLELVEQLNRLDPSIKKIIISVHDQFEYARQGMKFGVIDFLVKPVKKETLYKAVNQAIEQIEQNNRQKQELLLGNLARLLTAPELSADPMLHAYARPAYGMILINFEPDTSVKGRKLPELHPDELKRMIHSTSPQISEKDIQVIALDAAHSVVLLPGSARRTEGQPDTVALGLYQHLHHALSCHVHVSYAMKPVGASFHDTFIKLRRTVEDHRLFGRSSYLRPDSSSDVDLTVLWDRVRVMESYYKKGDLAKGEASLLDLVGAVRSLSITKRQLGLFACDLLFSLKFNLLEAKLGSINIHELQEDPALIHTVSDYRQLFVLLKDKICSLYCDAETAHHTPKGLIFVLLGIIHHHYQTNISLQQFAAEHHVSLGYLSRLFKSHTGLTFSEYIVDYRIRKAKELLSHGVDRLQEISRLVGYEDAKHFSLLFKKSVGESPMAYAKRLNGAGSKRK